MTETNNWRIDQFVYIIVDGVGSSKILSKDPTSATRLAKVFKEARRIIESSIQDKIGEGILLDVMTWGFDGGVFIVRKPENCELTFYKHIIEGLISAYKGFGQLIIDHGDVYPLRMRATAVEIDRVYYEMINENEIDYEFMCADRLSFYMKNEREFHSKIGGISITKELHGHIAIVDRELADSFIAHPSDSFDPNKREHYRYNKYVVDPDFYAENDVDGKQIADIFSNFLKNGVSPETDAQEITEYGYKCGEWLKKRNSQPIDMDAKMALLNESQQLIQEGQRLIQDYQAPEHVSEIRTHISKVATSLDDI